MDNIMIGVIRESECCNQVLMPKKISDELLGDMYADLTQMLLRTHPGAIEVATNILERTKYD